jgi:CO/xanthine dehydrogenase FAD-binding subunit
MSPTVHVPDSLPGVVDTLRGGGVVLAGGTALMPRLNTQVHDVGALVSLRRAGLAAVAVEGGRATVGAATTLSALRRDERLAFLHGALDSIASPTIRNLATLGGNLFVTQPYGDLAVCLLALDATATVNGDRELPVADVLAAGVGAGDVVSAVAFDVPAAGEWFYTKAMRRRLNSASIVTVAAVVKQSGGVVESARIALGGAGPKPVRATAAEAALVGQPLDREHVEAAAAAANADAEPFSDAYASAWYRERVLPVHIRRALLGE